MAGPGRPRKVQRRKHRYQSSMDGANLAMSIPQDLMPEWELRWVNDRNNRPYRLNQFDDWEFVDISEILDPNDPDRPLVGEREKPNIEGGSRVVFRAGSDDDGVIHAYLMKKRKEFCEADRAEKFKEMDKIDEELKRGVTPVEKQFGTVTIDHGKQH